MFSHKAANIWDTLYGAIARSESDVICKLWNKETDSSSYGKALDIGCGTGRFFIPLAQSGWDMTGVDSSEAMLSVLKQKMKKYKIEGETIHSDFSLFKNDKQFDLVLAFFSVIYTLTDKDMYSLFRKVHEVMNPGGLFLVNFFNCYEFWNKKGWNASMGRIFKSGHLKVDYASTPVDMLRGIANTEDMRLLSHNGKLASDASIRPVRYHSLNSMRLFITSAGFENVTFYSGFSDKKIGPEDTRATVITAAATRT